MGTLACAPSLWDEIDEALKHTKYVYMGEDYRFPALAFHDSRHEGVAVMIMTRHATVDATPRVLVPVDALPDNSFSREDQDIDALWECTEEALPRVR